MSYIDFHCHILPGIDDGPSDYETSVKMLSILKNQNVNEVCFTPHFNAHIDDVETFIKKRDLAIQKLEKILIQNGIDIKIHAGAEVALMHDISKVDDIEKLAYTFNSTTKYMLLELPLGMAYGRFILDEILNLTVNKNITPIFAHIHRYFYYKTYELESILNIPGAILQFNCNYLNSFNGRHRVLKLFNRGKPIVFGSDAHNLSNRKPNYDILDKKLISKLNNVKSEKLLSFSKIITL